MDNHPYQILSKDQLINVSYSSEGTYTWSFKITLTNNQVLYSHTQFMVTGNMDQYQDNSTTNLKNNLSQFQKHYIDPYVVSFNGSTPIIKGKATVYYRLAPGHSQITRPFIVAEGFDMGVIVSPTEEGGLTNIENFIASLSGFNETFLRDEVRNNYDIIYVDWNNGVDYIQNNADLFKKAIQWVNSQKQGAAKNVVLGQSMGGLIARYALKDMEDNNIDHDTELFISHDSPHLGANIPIGLQQMLVHVSKTYVRSPLAGAAEFLVPLFMQGISVKEVLTLADTPAARQMLFNYVDRNYNINNSVHDAWQTVIQTKGFPQQTRNVAISNGSECGTDQNLSDLLRLYKETNQKHLFSDVISTIVGGFIIRPDLILLSSLPGSSKYVFDFTVRPMTNINENKQLYSGSIKYKKKILWVINANVNLLNGSKNQPTNILPYDKYGGGRFDLDLTAIPNFLAQNLTINQFGFIPTPSALNYKFGTLPLQQSDFQKSFSFANDGINTPFSHFVAERIGQNNTHLSFSERNARFIVNQLSSNPSTQNLPLSSANLCGSNLIIGGESIICNSSTYTYTTAPVDSITWIITEGSALIDVIGASNSAQIKIQPKQNANGLVILQAVLTEDGSTATMTKKIWIGPPSFYINQTHTNINKRVSLYLQSTNPLATFEDMGLYPYNVSWYRPGNNITKQGGFTYAFTQNSLFLDGVTVEATVSNTCGISHVSGDFDPDSTYCGAYNITNTGGDSYSVNIINPCPTDPPTPNPPYGMNSYSTNSMSSSNTSGANLQNITIKVFNSMGVQILTTNNIQFNLSGLMIGTYYAKVIKGGNVVHTQTLLKN